MHNASITNSKIVFILDTSALQGIPQGCRTSTRETSGRSRRTTPPRPEAPSGIPSKAYANKAREDYRTDVGERMTIQLYIHIKIAECQLYVNQL